MAEVTVRQLAQQVGIPVDRLLSQLGESGLPHSDADESINEKDRTQLLNYLRRLQGKESESTDEAPKKIVLKRKAVSELKVTGQRGGRKAVTVEVRKRRAVRTPGETTPEEVVVEPEVAVVAPTVAVNKNDLVEAKRALHEEAKRRNEDLDDTIRADTEAREKAELLKPKPQPKPKPVVIEEPEPEVEATSPEPTVEALPPEVVAETIPTPVVETAKETVPKLVEQPSAPAVEATTRAVSGAASATTGAGASTAGTGAAKTDARKPDHRRPDRPSRGKAVRSDRGPARGGNDREELHVASDKRGRRRKKPAKSRNVVTGAVARHGFQEPTEPVVREVIIPDTISVGELAQRLSMKAPELIKEMIKLGTMATINQVIDQETASVLVEELGHKVKLHNENALEDAVLLTDDDRPSEQRSPVVTIMGHVDHGKTSLLDYIRRTKVADGEAGGITQHIGAYKVETDSGTITFLDTPGHAAFTSMRARGAKATDIVILVVAADDGVMPQTIEALQHAKAAAVPMIVAVNKMDKAGADPERIKQELSNHQVIPEEWGGDTIFVPVSALTGEGVESLLETITLQAEVLELAAPAHGQATGVIIESRLDRGRGPAATVLVQVGELKRGDILLAGQEYGRIRGMYDHTGQEIQSAGPSTPVEVLGLSGPPNAGDDVQVVADERKARDIASNRQDKIREMRLAKQQAGKLEDVFANLGEGEKSIINIVVKADVQGSVEALRDALSSLSGDEVTVNIVASGTGGISETDVNLALASQATVIGFNVRADSAARRMIESEKVDLRYYSVIYDAIDTIKAAVSGLLAPEIREQIVGTAQVREVFKSKRYGDIAGCIVLEGSVKRNLPIRVLRDNVVVYEGELESLRRHKDDVNEVNSGTECGIGVRNYDNVSAGDQIEVFERIEVQRTL
jgi:translation initiation factor IF-2